MEEQYELITSPLSQKVTAKALTVSLDIYRGVDTDWTLEIVDEFGNSTVWDELFPTDQAAFNEGMRTIHEEGIESLIGS